MTIDDRTEWLETDGLGGFASGTTSGVRTRRYHALLLKAMTPPTGRMVLVNGFDAWADTPAGTFALSSQRYVPDVISPDGAAHITRFASDPWPTWDFALPDGTGIRQEIFVRHGIASTVVTWAVLRSAGPLVLRVRPFLSGRDYHALHRENSDMTFGFESEGALVAFRLYDGVPGVLSFSNGDYRHAPEWYRQFLYSAERERGLDDSEDLASPGEISFALAGNGRRAVWVLRPDNGAERAGWTAERVLRLADAESGSERARRGGFPTATDRAADAYLVRRGTGRTIVAGYPWFTDWGRDTFIAVRGLCLATGRLAEARDILVEWAGAVSEGMLPNRFPDRGELPEFNSVDASLWYVISVDELLRVASARAEELLTPEQRTALESATTRIVAGYAQGTRFGIRMDADGLLAAGEPGSNLTWMDARVGDRVITPRVGKAVEIQALWLNAVSAAGAIDRRWRSVFIRGRRAFIRRFWNEARGRLADVVDVDHVAGTRDDSLRPNQILAVGGLPVALVNGVMARQIVDVVEQELWTPLGLRSLARGEPQYARCYKGGASERDAVYHQGTVWPWLIGPFVEAWVRVRGQSRAARVEARSRFLEPFRAHLLTAGIGHISEIADGEAPFEPRGCPFQAWSLGEFLRLERSVLAEPTPKRTGRSEQMRQTT